MRVPTFSLLSTTLSIAAVGTAFLIPPQLADVAVAEINISDLGVLTAPDPKHRVIKASCKGCLQDGKDGALVSSSFKDT